MDDKQELKSLNPIVDVIRQTEVLSFDETRGLWIGVDGLTVNPDKGRFYRGDDSGDVIAWLKLRFGWEFGEAMKYLKNRAALPPEQRAAGLQAVQVGGNPAPVAEMMTQKAVELKAADQRYFEALRLLADYPAFGRVMACADWFALILERAWIPVQFQALFGNLEVESCDFCGASFEGWQEIGRAALAVEIGPNYEMIPAQQGAGVYCSSCIASFRRWSRGLGLLSDARRAGSQAELITTVLEVER